MVFWRKLHYIFAIIMSVLRQIRDKFKVQILATEIRSIRLGFGLTNFEDDAKI